MSRGLPWNLVEIKLRMCQRVLGKDVCNQVADCVISGNASQLHELLHGENVPRHQGRTAADLAMLLAQMRRDPHAVDMVRVACNVQSGWRSPHTAGFTVAVAQRDPTPIATYQKDGANYSLATQALLDTKQAHLLDAVPVRTLMRSCYHLRSNL
jgi:hypothetical protein